MFGTLLPLDERERSVHELIAAARAGLGEVPGRQIRSHVTDGLFLPFGQREGEQPTNAGIDFRCDLYRRGL